MVRAAQRKGAVSTACRDPTGRPPPSTGTAARPASTRGSTPSRSRRWTVTGILARSDPSAIFTATARPSGRPTSWSPSKPSLAAAAVTHLAGRPAHTELHVHLEHRDGRLAVRIEDPGLGAGSAAALRGELAGDVERLAALGGAVEVTEYAAGVTVLAWLPDRLEPLVEPGTAA